MSRVDTFFWVLLPYVALTSFVVGHVWRYRRDGYTWTARSTQLLERRLLFVGSFAFHLGMLGVIGGHVIGTQGTPVEVLGRRLDVRFFPALWDVRNALTAEAQTSPSQE